MKKLLAVTGVILIVYVIISAAAARESVPQTQAEQDGGVIYTLCDEDDRVVVYRGGTVVLRTDTPVSALPKRDRLRLREGISVYSDKELKRIVEDLCS